MASVVWLVLRPDRTAPIGEDRVRRCLALNVRRDGHTRRGIRRCRARSVLAPVGLEGFLKRVVAETNARPPPLLAAPAERVAHRHRVFAAGAAARRRHLGRRGDSSFAADDVADASPRQWRLVATGGLARRHRPQAPPDRTRRLAAGADRPARDCASEPQASRPSPWPASGGRLRGMSQSGTAGGLFSSRCSRPPWPMYPSLLAHETEAKERLVATEYGIAGGGASRGPAARLQQAVEQIDAIPSLADFVNGRAPTRRRPIPHNRVVAYRSRHIPPDVGVEL